MPLWSWTIKGSYNTSTHTQVCHCAPSLRHFPSTYPYGGLHLERLLRPGFSNRARLVTSTPHALGWLGSRGQTSMSLDHHARDAASLPSSIHYSAFIAAGSFSAFRTNCMYWQCTAMTTPARRTPFYFFVFFIPQSIVIPRTLR